jgi:hypothetical protein
MESLVPEGIGKILIVRYFWLRSAMITRKTPETKLFTEWGGRAERYRKEELAEAFRIAGFEDLHGCDSRGGISG